MKKSRLSLAAIAALGITTASLSANNLVDIPLPSGEWKFIGVNGGFIETASDITVPSDYSGTITETLDDNASTTNGTNGTNSSTGTGVIGFTVIDHISGTSEFSSAVLNYNGSNHTYSSSATIPEMYVYVNTGDSNTTPDIRVKFQGDYEGETFYLTLGSNIYSGTFLSGATYDNAQELTVYFEQAASTASDGNLSVDYVFDRNISNNPSKPGVRGSANDYYYSSYHNDLNGTDDLRIYTYNAVNQSWETYVNKSGTVINSDFTSLEKGKGYWVKFTPHNNNNDGGLILGDTGITSSDYNASSLKAGWNMLSFNDSQVRSGATGLKLTLSSTDLNITIADSEGTDSIDINSSLGIVVGTDGIKSMASLINRKIAGAIKRGELSSNFNVRAYPSSSTTGSTLVLISDRKFRISDYNDDTARGIAAVTTLAGKNPFDLNSSSLARIAMPQLKSAGVESVYGEYVLATKLVADTSAPLVNLHGKIRVNDNTPVESNTSFANFITSSNGIDDDADIDAVVNIDTDFDGTLDTALLINNNENFYIRDNTWTKVYKFENNTTDLSKIYIDLNQSDISIDVTPIAANDDNASSIASYIRTKIAAQSGTYTATGTDINISGDTTTGLIYLMTNNENYKNIALEEGSGDSRFVEVFNSTEDNASGTIKEVYTLDNLAQATIQDTIATITIASSLTAGDKAEFNLSNEFAPANEFNITIYDCATIGAAAVGANGKEYIAGTYNGITIGNAELNISSSGAAAKDYNITYSSGQAGSNVTTFSQVSALAAHAINYIFEKENYPAIATYSGDKIYIKGDKYYK